MASETSSLAMWAARGQGALQHARSLGTGLQESCRGLAFSPRQPLLTVNCFRVIYLRFTLQSVMQNHRAHFFLLVIKAPNAAAHTWYKQL